MKNIILSLLLCITFFQLKSQTYTPLHLDIGTQWLISKQDVYFPVTQYRLDRFSVVDDTLIQNLNYAKIKVEGYIKYQNVWNGPSAPYYIFLRNDTLNKKVYYSDANFSDQLLYDFDLSLNDTLKNYRVGLYCGSDDPVDSILQKNFFGTIRTTYIPRLDTINSLTDKGALIEGIGSINGFFNYVFPYVPFECWNYIYTRCVTYQLQTLFSGLDGTTPCSCDIVAIPFPPANVNTHYKDDVFDVYPNPATNELNIKSKSTSSEPQRIQIFNVFGQLVKSETLNLDTPIHKLNISDLSKGIYSIRIHGNEKNTTIYSVQKFVVE